MKVYHGCINMPLISSIDVLRLFGLLLTHPGYIKGFEPWTLLLFLSYLYHVGHTCWFLLIYIYIYIEFKKKGYLLDNYISQCYMRPPHLIGTPRTC